MRLFVVATVLPCGLVSLAALFGGVWAWLAFGYMAGLVAVLDRLIAREAENSDPDAEFPAATSLLICLGSFHFILLALCVWAVGGPSGLSGLERAVLALAAGMIFGQISHPVAHELIHKPPRALRLLGQWIYTSLLMGHHASAHLLVHHVHVGSGNDPNSAPRGEGFYRFALRAWRQSFRAGLEAENRRRARAVVANRAHPYLLYTAGAGLALAAAFALAGPGGAAALLGMAVYAQLQILLSDYVQHYGLRRAILANGRSEPVGPQHSWNAPHIFSSALMLNAPRHSDHHVTPSRVYPALQLDAGAMPCLPRPLPVMAALALVPPLWFRVMDPLCDRWQPGQVERGGTTARDIPQAVLRLAKSGGAAAPHLPDSGHANLPPESEPEPDDRRAGRDGGRHDERGRV